MKTLEEIFSIEHLLATHKRCRNSKQHKREVINFELDLGHNLLAIQKSILNRTYTIKRYRKMTIFEPKQRDIEWLPYKHRIVQNCLCEYLLRPTLEKKLIYDNCACRINKGTDFARSRLTKFVNKIKNQADKIYYLKCDIKKFFPSIDHDILRTKLEKIFPPEIMWLLNIYINTAPTPVGIPIGNQTSQWFALVYLNDIDHFIKEKCKIKYYLRYMDDLVLLHKSKKHLKNVLNLLTQQISLHKIKFNNKTQINTLNQSVGFLGFYFCLKNKKLTKKLNKDAQGRIKRSKNRNNVLYYCGIRDFTDYCSVLINYKNYFRKNQVWHARME